MTHFLIFFTKLLLLKMGISLEKGQGLAEYVLMLLLIAIVVIGALELLGDELISTFTQIVNEFP
jgi:Flp pilus assembly pilin Flp